VRRIEMEKCKSVSTVECDLVKMNIEAVYCSTCDCVYRNFRLIFDDELDGNFSESKVDALGALIDHLQVIYDTQSQSKQTNVKINSYIKKVLNNTWSEE